MKAKLIKGNVKVRSDVRDNVDDFIYLGRQISKEGGINKKQNHFMIVYVLEICKYFKYDVGMVLQVKLWNAWFAMIYGSEKQTISKQGEKKMRIII